MPQFPEARFVGSAWQPQQFPPDQGVEVAFAGRSNAGKSSALNAIAGRKDLARTSKTPGRTQLINFFELSDARRLVDLPGYGYAKVPEHMKQHWQELLTSYIESRAALSGLVVVMDARRPLTDFDLQMLDWSTAHRLAVHFLLTKADKLSRGEANSVLKRVQSAVAEVATVQLFSAVAKTGIDEARRQVLQMLETRRSAPEPAPLPE